jgi:hypothetical protein
MRSSFVVLLEFLTKVALAGQSAGYVFKTQLLKITRQGNRIFTILAAKGSNGPPEMHFDAIPWFFFLRDSGGQYSEATHF